MEKTFDQIINCAEKRILDGLSYGEDMLSSKRLCMEDAINLIDSAYVKANTREQTERLIFLKRILIYFSK